MRLMLLLCRRVGVVGLELVTFFVLKSLEVCADVRRRPALRQPTPPSAREGPTPGGKSPSSTTLLWTLFTHDWYAWRVCVCSHFFVSLFLFVFFFRFFFVFFLFLSSSLFPLSSFVVPSASVSVRLLAAVQCAVLRLSFSSSLSAQRRPVATPIQPQPRAHADHSLTGMRCHGKGKDTSAAGQQAECTLVGGGHSEDQWGRGSGRSDEPV